MAQGHLNSNMKRVELKRIVEFLWKGSPADEKTPFAAQGTNNGSYSKNLEADDNKKAAKEFSGEEGGSVEGPMSISRKVCFAMSFNVWILYFLVLGWLLPCRQHECGLPYAEIVERSLPNIRPLTDMEPMNAEGLPSLAMLGYSEGKELRLAALATFDATIEWNISLPFVPEKIQCNFEHVFDTNQDGIQDCLLSGFQDVYAFNASDGHVFWHRRLTSEEGDILSGFHPTSMIHNTSFLIGTYGNKMVFLNPRTGNKTMESYLPCSSPIDTRLVSNTVNGNATEWSLVCNYGDKIEAWGFDERVLLRRGDSEEDSNEFTLLFRGSNSDGSIDLRRDVTVVPGGPLLLSLADRVAMVTREKTAWEQHMPYPLSVEGIAVGNFSNVENELAVSIRNGTDTFVVLIDLQNRTFLNDVTLSNRNALSLENVPGDEDLLLVKSVIPDNSTHQPDIFTDPEHQDGQMNFVLIDFRASPVKVNEVANETSVLRSSVNIQMNGETDLLILKSSNDTTTYVRHLIRPSDAQKSICHSIIDL